MDKYETGLKIQEIERLYHANKYRAAAELAKEIDWPRVKMWEPLAMMIDIHEHLDEYEEARDMAILAYNRNLGGKRLLFRLTDLFINTGDLSNAKELFKEYCVSAKTSSDKYILQYHLLRAQKAPDSELIRALENYREKEVDERYLYRLAQLYAKTGAPEKCVSICDDIYSMFRDGDYVEGAIKLKKRVGGRLSDEQNKILHKSRVREEELSKTAQLTFEDQLRLSKKVKEIEEEAGFKPLSKDSDDDAIKAVAKATSAMEKEKEEPKSDDLDEYEAALQRSLKFDIDDDLQNLEHFQEESPKSVHKVTDVAEPAKEVNADDILKDIMGDDEKTDEEPISYGMSNDLAPEKERKGLFGFIKKKFSSNDLDYDEDFEDEDFIPEFNPRNKTDEPIAEDYTEDKKLKDKKLDTDYYDDVTEKEVEDMYVEDESDMVEEELSENTGKTISSYEPEVVSDDNDHVVEDIDTAEIPDLSAYKEDAKLAEYESMKANQNDANLSDNLKGLISAAKQKIDSDYEKMVRYGQVARKSLEVRDAMDKNPTAASVREILEQERALGGFGDEEEQIEGQLNMRDWMNEVREQKYGKQNTKEYSKTELERLLDEKDEKSLAYDKLMEEQRRLAREAGKPFNEAVAKQKVEGQMMVNAAKTDLAIRTGKATEKLENEIPAVGKPESVEEKIVNTMMDLVKPKSEKAPINLDILADKFKSIGDVPEEVASAAAMLMSFLSGQYVPNSKKAEEPKDTVVLKARPVSSDFSGEKIAPIGILNRDSKSDEAIKEPVIEEEVPVKATTSDWEPVPEDAFEEEPIVKHRDSIEDDIASTDKEIFGRPGFIPSVLDNNYISPEFDLDTDLSVSDKSEELGLDLESEESATILGQELEQPTPVSQVVEEDDDEFIEEPNQTTANIKEMLENDKFFSDISPEELEDILNTDAAEKQKNVDAVDKITARITGVYDKPIITPEILASMGINEDEDISVPEHEPSIYDTAGIDKQVLRDIIDSKPEEEEVPEEDLDSIGDKYSKTGMHDPQVFEEALAATLPEGKHQKVIEMFEEFYDMPNIDEQIEKWIASLPREMNRSDSTVGNIAISGEDANVNANLAKNIARAVNLIYPDFKKKLARISVDSINSGGILKAIVKFRGSALLIEDAGDIRPEVATEMVSELQSDTKRIIFILEDSEERLNNLFMVNPELSKAFNHKILLRNYSVDELVEVAKEFALRKEFTLSQEACEKIAGDVTEFKKKEPVISLDDMDQFVNEAIRRAGKRLKKERKKDPSVENILVAADFK